MPLYNLPRFHLSCYYICWFYCLWPLDEGGPPDGHFPFAVSSSNWIHLLLFKLKKKKPIYLVCWGKVYTWIPCRDDLTSCGNWFSIVWIWDWTQVIRLGHSAFTCSAILLAYQATNSSKDWRYPNLVVYTQYHITNLKQKLLIWPVCLVPSWI